MTKDRRGHLERNWLVDVLTGGEFINPCFKQEDGEVVAIEGFTPSERKI